MNFAVASEQPVRMAGCGWTADVYRQSIDVAVDPSTPGDSLVAAIDELIAPAQRRYWTVSWEFEDSAGNDVYLMLRES